MIAVEKLTAEAGSAVAFDEVLLLGDGADVTAGAPLVTGASVKADVVEQTRGDKIIVFKKKRRKNYRRRQGHRQDLTVVRITDIIGADGKLAASAAKPKAKAKPAAKAKETPAKTEAGAPAKAKAARPPPRKRRRRKLNQKAAKTPAAGAAKSKPKAKKPAAEE